MRPESRSPRSAPRQSSRKGIEAWGIFLWSLAVQGSYLAGELLLDRPVSPLFFGDALHYLREAQTLAQGGTSGAVLPRPPLTSWCLVPLWRFLGEPSHVFVASKILMSLCGAATVAGIYLLLRRTRFPHPALAAALVPLSFGELLLGSSVNSETVYRLLLVALLLLGARWPIVGGLLHGLATLTRAEHLFVVGALALWALSRPERRRTVALSAVGFCAVLLPWGAHTHALLAEYNRAHAEELSEPLPEWVPVSFYGPLDFALAQNEATIYFSRRNLPVPRGDATALDPTDPTHNRYIVHGYRIGLDAIASDPVRFLQRTANKLLFSLRGLAWGWTWRDLPHEGPWVRRPVDMASAAGRVYTGLFLALAGYGAWTLRRERSLLLVVGALIAYRLSMNLAFFPYLRSMAIASPGVIVLAAGGISGLFRHLARPALLVIVALLATYQLGTGWRVRNYSLSGERDAEGRILDDRTVTLELTGFLERR